MNWPDLAALAAVALAFAGIFLLRRRVNFTVLTLVALGAGLVIGLLARGHAAYIEPIGRIYINVLLAAVVPLVVVSIISSVTSLGTTDKLRSIGVRAIAWLVVCNALAVVLALGLALAVGIGKGVGESLGGEELSVLENSVQDFSEVVVGFFPSNIVGDFGANRIIPIILISIAVAVAYLSLSRRDPAAVRPFRSGIEALRLVVFEAVGYVIRLTPYAIVALTATFVAESADLGPKFWSLIGLLVLAWVTCFADTFLVNSVILRVFADVSPFAFFRKIFPAQVTAFVTQSSVGTLPVTTHVLERRVGVEPQVAGFVAPLGTTIGMPGCSGIWPILIAVWGINAYSIPYSGADYLVLGLLATVVSLGTAGVPGTATVAAATVLAAAGLPLEFIAVTLPISMIADMARTMTNVTAAAVSATVVAHQTGLLDRDIFDGTAEFEPLADEVEVDPAEATEQSTEHSPEPRAAAEPDPPAAATPPAERADEAATPTTRQPSLPV